MNIPFSKVDCSGNELKYIQQVLESGWLTTAGKCAEFEKRFAEYIGVKQVTIVHGVGESVTKITESGSRMGFVIAQGENSVKAIEDCEKALSKIKVVVDEHISL